MQTIKLLLVLLPVFFSCKITTAPSEEFDPFDTTYLNSPSVQYGHFSTYHWAKDYDGWQILESTVDFADVVWDSDHIRLYVRQTDQDVWLLLDNKLNVFEKAYVSEVDGRSFYNESRILVPDPEKNYADYKYVFCIQH
jgi:hypothetical protein